LAAQQTAATLIRHAVLLDGRGGPARQADIRIVGDRIAEVGRLAPRRTDHVVDADGLALAPGFIDTHSHHDGGLFEDRNALAAVSQGITTIVVGQDGDSHFPLARFFAQLDSTPAAINVASYVGHGTVRSEVMGEDFKRAATGSELDRMRTLVLAELQAGALGLSTGLEYDPGIYSDPQEVLELAKVVAAAGGRYISHIRSEDRRFWQALDELLTIGQVTGMPVQISHAKLAMRSLWGLGDSLITVLDRARAKGIRVTADIYPYTFWQATLTVLYPARDFTNRATTDFILREIAAPGDLLMARFDPDSAYVGKTVAQIAAARGTDPATTLMALINETQADGVYESVIATGMDERDVARIMRWPFANICSDGELSGRHPRGFGAFPRVLAHFVRSQHVASLEEAIRKMTNLAAANMGIAGRGTIERGNFADLVLFDPEAVEDRATPIAPHAQSVGIRTVWVNGQVVFDAGGATGQHPGRVLRRVTRR
jgi:N-acyl-D-amino-acid deacylase